jgi:hypothetical protein
MYLHNEPTTINSSQNVSYNIVVVFFLILEHNKQRQDVSLLKLIYIYSLTPQTYMQALLSLISESSLYDEYLYWDRSFSSMVFRENEVWY